MNESIKPKKTAIEIAVEEGKLHQKKLNKKSRDLSLVQSAIPEIESSLALAKANFRGTGKSEDFKIYQGLKNIYQRECMYRKKLKKEVKRTYNLMRLAVNKIKELDI